MSTERRQREGIAPGPEEQDPLSVALGETICKCCDEMGAMGCSNCPVERKCHRIWQQGVEDPEKVTMTEYRRLSKKFDELRRERDCILAKRRQGVPQRAI